MPEIYVHRTEEGLHKTELQYSPSATEQSTNMAPLTFAQYPKELVFSDIILISESPIFQRLVQWKLSKQIQTCANKIVKYSIHVSLVNEWKNNYYILNRYAILTIHWTPC